MRKVVLYIAMSLDGYIAKKDGSVDWLEGENPNSQADGEISDFLETIDTIIIGYRTYRQIVTELMPGAWPYDGKEVYVLTHEKHESDAAVCFIDTDVDKLIEEICSREGRNIWICGGAEIVDQCMRRNLIDIYQITVIPCILGSGIRLFAENGQDIKLNLLSTKHYNGMAELIYEQR